MNGQPRLTLDLIWSLFFSLQWSAIREHLTKVEQMLGVDLTELVNDPALVDESGRVTQLSPDEQAMVGEAAMLAAQLAIFRAGNEHALALTDVALRLMADDNLRLRNLLMQLRGFAFRLSGSGAQAIAALTAATALAQKLGTLATQTAAQCDLAEVEMMQGQLGRAAQTFQGVMALAGKQRTWPLLSTSTFDNEFT